MLTLTSLNFYPIKSCGGISLNEATITAAGLMFNNICDRQWMVVDAHGVSLTQREYPKMALITPCIAGDLLALRAPRMSCLEIPLDLPHPSHAPSLPVRLWYDDIFIKAYDCGETAATWFSKAIGVSCRMVRFPLGEKRSTSTTWTDGVAAPILFSDGYPMLVISEASLSDLNQKLVMQGQAALPMNRFRPNIVIGGAEAFDEDYAESLKINHAILKLAKPCPRCVMPSIDQATGLVGHDPLSILQTYRANPRLDGAITFGMNAILLAGAGQVLRTGQEAELTLAF